VTTRARRLLAGLIVATAIAGACSGGAATPVATSGPPSSAPSTNPAAASDAPLTIYGAASLKGALDALKPAWESGHRGSILTLSTDSSAALETQIEQGAPADVFLSADQMNPRKLVDKGLADGVALSFAGNALTIVVPTGNPGNVRTPADLGRPGLKIIAAGDDVPITTYADQALAQLAGQPGYPSNFVAAYAANVVSKEDNVKAVIAKVELGEGDAGIVYVTDARSSSKAATVAIPDAANASATYAGVVVKASGHTATAHAFLDWLAGPEGRAILRGFGFVPPAD
jgi:molybdate transport system substrate-binding protein